MGGDFEVGSLSTARTAIELRAGTVAPGELLRVLCVRRVVRRARGPEPDLPDQHEEDEWSDVVRVEAAPDDVLRLAPAPRRFAGRVRGWFAALRERGLERARAHEDELSRGLLAALLFGQRGEMPPGVTDLFTRTGTRHLLALSGLHVALLGWLLVRPFGAWLSGASGRIRIGGREPRPVRPELACAILVLCAIPVGGGSPPVTRAAIALALATIAPLLPSASRVRGEPRPGRRVDALSLFAFALTLECLANPLAPLRIDVQLSYAATLGLIMGFTGARRLVDAAWGGRLRIAETWASSTLR